MKTQIVTLESHDDLISVRDRLSWAKTPRILLIWPKGVPVALRPLDLKVLQRHADSLGAQLGIVTRRDWVRREAEALGLPVFRSSAAAQKEAWPKHAPRRRRTVRHPRRDLRELREEILPAEPVWRSSLAVRVAAFAAGVLAVLVVVTVFVPRASIQLYPPSRMQELVFPVSARLAGDSALPAGSVPAREEKEVVSGSWAMGVSGHRMSIPVSAARGVARFRNLTQEEVNIPAGTMIFPLADPENRFKTLNGTRITPGLDQFVETPVEAVRAGKSGNLEAGTLQAIEGPLGLLAAVDNPEPTSGGSERTVTGPNENDREVIRGMLITHLMPEAETLLKGKLYPDVVLIEDTGKASRVLEEVYDPPAGQAGTVLKLDARIEFSFRVVSTEDLRQFAEAALNARLPQGFRPSGEELDVLQATVPQTDETGVTRWQLRASRRLLRSMDAAAILESVRGRSAGAARAALVRSYAWERPPELVLSPSWWPWLPLIPFRTSVDFH
jgi:hypothetical protein